MAGDGEERAVDVAEGYRKLAKRLDGVRVKQDARIATSRGQLGHGLHRTDLVVHPHHAHDRDTALQRLVECLALDLARRGHREDELLAS